jgi:hypothetical protein
MDENDPQRVTASGGFCHCRVNPNETILFSAPQDPTSWSLPEGTGSIRMPFRIERGWRLRVAVIAVRTKMRLQKLRRRPHPLTRSPLAP